MEGAEGSFRGAAKGVPSPATAPRGLQAPGVDLGVCVRTLLPTGQQNETTSPASLRANSDAMSRSLEPLAVIFLVAVLVRVSGQATAR